MIKVCSPQLGMSPHSSLGGEIYDHQTIKGFGEKGIKTFVYLPKNRYFDQNIKHLKVSYCFTTHIIPPLIYSFLSLPYIISTYKKEKFDVLRIHVPRFLGLAAAIFHFFYPHTPILVSAVNVEKSGIYYFIEKLTYQIATKIIVQSEHMKNYVAKKYNINFNKIEVTYGGILDGDTSFKSKPAQAVLIKKNDRVLLFMGVLTPRKNPLFALEVFKKIKEKNKNVKLIIIGDGSEKQKISYEISKNNLTDVIMVNHAYKDEKKFWFSRMDIFLCPSKNEGFGLVATEAMSFGKVVIASDRAAFKEIIDSGKNGYTLPLEQLNEWTKTIDMLLKNNKTKLSIGKEALKKVKQKFSWEKMYDLNHLIITSMLKR